MALSESNFGMALLNVQQSFGLYTRGLMYHISNSIL